MNSRKEKAETYVTNRRISSEGLSEAFLREALANVQTPLFGDWPLYGSGRGYGDHDNNTTTWCFGTIFGRGGLDLKTRALLILAGLCVLQREALIRIWTNAALNAGWSEAEIKEMGMWVALFGGFPTSRGSVLIFDDVFEKRRQNPEAKWV